MNRYLCSVLIFAVGNLHPKVVPATALNQSTFGVSSPVADIDSASDLINSEQHSASVPFVRDGVAQLANCVRIRGFHSGHFHALKMQHFHNSAFISVE